MIIEKIQETNFLEFKPKILEINKPNGDNSFTIRESEDFLKSTVVVQEKSIKLKRKKASEIFSEIFLKNDLFHKKIWFFLRHFLFYHAIGLSVNGILMFISIKFGNSCVFKPEYQQKRINFAFFLGIFIQDFFVLGCLLSLGFNICTFQKKHLIFFLIFFMSLWIIGLSYLHFLNYEGSLDHQTFMSYYHSMCMVFLMIYNFILLFKIRNIKNWITNFFKGGSFLIFFLYVNWIFCLKIIGPLFELTRESLGNNWGMNVNKLILMIHSILLAFLLKTLLFFHYETLINEKVEQNPLNSQVINFNRICLTYILSMNAVGIIRMGLTDWGGWFLLISYWLFLIHSLARLDLKGMALKRMFTFFTIKNAKKIEKSENKQKFEKIFSGCFLDLIVIFSSRLIIMVIFDKWSCISQFEQLNDGCDFNISLAAFPINLWSVIIIILINFVTVSGIIIYVNVKKTPLIFYKTSSRRVMNIYTLSALNFLMEILLQMFAIALFN